MNTVNCQPVKSHEHSGFQAALPYYDMRNYKTWFRTAAILQLITAAIHALSFLNDPKPNNETEKTLFDLMRNYRSDLAGSMVSMEELLTALSSCFSFVYLFGGLINLWLLRKTQDETVLGGVLVINLVVFGPLFAIMAIYTFPPPILFTGLVFFFLLLAAFIRRLSVR